MKNIRETTSVVALGSATEERDAVKAAFQEVQSSFENFCLLAGIEAFQDLLEDEAADLCGERHQRHEAPGQKPRHGSERNYLWRPTLPSRCLSAMCPMPTNSSRVL